MFVVCAVVVVVVYLSEKEVFWVWLGGGAREGRVRLRKKESREKI